MVAVDTVLAIYPENAAACANKAHALIVLGNSDEAETALRSGRTAVQTDERIAKMLANLLMRTNRSAEALALADEILLTGLENDEVWSIKGAACAYLGRKNDAISTFERAMKMNPKEKSYKHNRDAIKKS